MGGAFNSVCEAWEGLAFSLGCKGENVAVHMHIGPLYTRVKLGICGNIAEGLQGP